LRADLLSMGRLLIGNGVPAKFFIRLALLLLLFLLAGQLYLVIDEEVYPGVHLVMEFASVVVAICASLMSWYDYRYKRELRMLLFSLTFCTVGLLDFAHVMSYLGMLDFITPNSANKASTYWIISRFLQGTGILAAVISGNLVKRITRPAMLLVFASLGIIALIVAVAFFLPALPAMYNPAAGSQTALKIYLEYLIIALMGLSLAALLLSKKMERRDYYLGLALAVGILSEAAFTLYSSAYDIYIFLGHVYKLLSFAFIFKALLDEAVVALFETNRALERQREILAETNRQLQEADRLKDDFLANTNHELRTPLTAVIAFTELLLDDSTGKLNELQRDYLNEINDSGKELLGRINGFLNLSKIAAGKTVLYREVFEVDGFVADMARPMCPLFDNKGVTLQISKRRDGPRMWADREKAGQVLTNLLSNALKFTPPGGRVAVECGVCKTGREVYIAVKDTGIGIDPADREKIFQPFQQVDGTRVRRYGGTGIGLTLAKKLVELHGGDIKVDSEPGKGSVFSFTMPAEDKAEPGKLLGEPA